MEHFIKIAEIKVIESPGILKTVVGSCIALCIWDSVKKIGGMVHIMMPKNDNTLSVSKGKYADTAVHVLCKEMIYRNCHRHNMIASVIGGASLFNRKLENQGVKTIGVKNYEIVKRELDLHKIAITMEDVGGTSGRRVIFDCADGDIVVTMLRKSSPVKLRETVDG